MGRGFALVSVACVLVVCCARSGWGAPSDFLEGAEAPVLYSVDGERAGDQFGWVVTAVGDCDGDGASDFIAAAPFHSPGVPSGGRVTLHSGATGKRLHSVDGFAGELLGWSVAAVSDVDGDGVPDFIAGAPASAAGRAVVVSGRTGKVILERHGEVPGDRFGDKVIGLGDVDDDGRADFAVSAPLHDAAGIDAGRVTLHSGSDGRVLRTWDGSGPGDQLGRSLGAGPWRKGWLLLAGSVLVGGRKSGAVTAWDASSGAVLTSFTGDGGATDLASHFISVAGDTDGDGMADLYISDWMHGARGPVTGRVWILSAADWKPRLELTGGGAGAGFGIGDGRAGDVDGDGTADLVIGAWLDARGAAKGGRVEVRSGRNGAVLGSWTCTRAGDNFGFDATGLGDVNKDGFVDFLATSCGGNAAPSPAGRVWVLSGAALRRTAGVATAATVERAAALLATGNRGAAAKEARAVVDADGSNATAWHHLGLALHGEGKWKEALEAHLRSTSLPSIAPTGHFNAGCAAALLGRTDEAFAHLGRAVAAGFGAVAMMQKDDDLISLRGDVRMAALVGAMQSRVPPPFPSGDGGNSWKLVALREARRRSEVDAAAVVPSAPETAFDLPPGEWTGTRENADGASARLRVRVTAAEGGCIEEATTVTRGEATHEECVVGWIDAPTGNRIRYVVGDGAQRLEGPPAAGGRAGQLVGVLADGAFLRLRWETDDDGTMRRVREVSRDGGARWETEWREALVRHATANPPR